MIFICYTKDAVVAGLPKATAFFYSNIYIFVILDKWERKGYTRINESKNKMYFKN